MKFLYFTLLFSYFTCTSQFTPQGINEFLDATNLHLLHDVDDPMPMVLSICPNPMKSEAKIIISNYVPSVKLYVYDTYGREVLTVESSSNSINLQRDKLGPGMYKLALGTNQGAFFQKRILIVE